MQKKHLIGAGITAFSVILGLLWLIPLIWLIGTAFSVPSFHMHCSRQQRSHWIILNMYGMPFHLAPITSTH